MEAVCSPLFEPQILYSSNIHFNNILSSKLRAAPHEAFKLFSENEAPIIESRPMIPYICYGRSNTTEVQKNRDIAVQLLCPS
jgi:hypothetical protein